MTKKQQFELTVSDMNSGCAFFCSTQSTQILMSAHTFQTAAMPHASTQAVDMDIFPEAAKVIERLQRDHDAELDAEAVRRVSTEAYTYQIYYLT